MGGIRRPLDRESPESVYRVALHTNARFHRQLMENGITGIGWTLRARPAGIRFRIPVALSHQVEGRFLLWGEFLLFGWS